MFNIFKKKKKIIERKEPNLSAREPGEVLQNAIDAKKDDDPIITLKIGASDLKSKFLELSKDEKGVHIETALGVLGALAGNYCLISGVAIQEASAGKAGNIQRIGAKDGKTYYVGELINRPLLTDQLSVWELVGGIAQQLGAKQLPDIKEIVEYTAKTIGNSNFGEPRIDEKHKLRKNPIKLIQEYHPVLINIITQHTQNPLEFPILLGLTIQQLISDGKVVIDPSISAKIVMECAVPMSKLESSGMLQIS